MSWAAGDNFAGFGIVRKLGEGGMGEVYLVDHPRLPRQEALKILPARFTADYEFRERFNREAELAAALWHPHIVAVHDRGEFDQLLWITMSYVEGIDAHQMIRDRYPSGAPPGLVVEIVTAVADALDYAHERGLLHRDVKPANILLSDSDPGAARRRILLSDFGIARVMDDNTGLTATNMTVGSVAYAAPEQLMGKTLDARADQYALAASAYQLLTGRPPFENSNAAVVISSHLSVPPPAMAVRRPDLRALDPVIARALAKSPADRYATCTEFANALAGIVSAAPGTDHATMVTPIARPPSTATVVSGPAAGTPPSMPRPPQPPPPPPPAPPPPPPAPAAAGSSRKGVLIGAAVVVVALVVAGVLLGPKLLKSEESSGAAGSSAARATSAAASAVVAPAAADGLLLTIEEVTAVTGGNLVMSSASQAPLDSTRDINRPECAGAIYPLEGTIYGPKGFTAARQNLLVPPEGTEGNLIVDQSVALMPTAAVADRFLTDSERQWQACAGVSLTITMPDATTYPQLADVERVDDNVITQHRAVTGDTAPNQRCQHTLGVSNNVVAEVVVCNDTDIGDQSQQMVDQILAKARAQ